MARLRRSLAFAAACSLALLASQLLLQAHAQEADDASGGGQPASRTWYQIHGWGMWAAFGVLLPLGIIISGIGQDFLPGWFHLHWMIQTVGVLVAIGAYVIAVVKFKAFDNNHAYIGTAVFAAAVVNLVAGAIARPKRGSIVRTMWYPVHFFIGTSAVLLGWYNITLGFRIYQEQYGRMHGLWIALLSQLAGTGMAYLLLSRLPRWRMQAVAPDAVTQGTYAPSVTNGSYVEQGPGTTPMQDLTYKRRADGEIV
eukprot:SM000150S01724  [mRNA]  locus=s150:216328:217951:+ [translate_table: standard]